METIAFGLDKQFQWMLLQVIKIIKNVEYCVDRANILYGRKGVQKHF